MIGQFHYKNLPLPSAVAALKARRGIRVSCVIPTLNEESSITAIITDIRAGCMRQVALVDEIIVIDSSSVDATHRKAASAGARVFGINDIAGAPRVPAGKGSALWKSLWVGTGDIVVCLDADIANFEPYFVSSLVAPLLLDESLYFVKAYYQRPLMLNNMVYENFGGRVTEILVRPFLNVFFPELARLYQPLSGEYAFARSAMETVSFCSGYGVEVHCLFEFLRRFGLAGIAQVDIGTRLHRNRPTAELGKMAFAILQVLLNNAADQKALALLQQINTTMTMPGQTGWDTVALAETILPPYRDYIRNPQTISPEFA